jgi:hypothetical protein
VASRLHDYNHAAPWAAANVIRSVLSTKSCAQVSCLTANEKAVLKSGESRGRKGLIEEEQRKNKRRKATWGYSTAERAKS